MATIGQLIINVGMDVADMIGASEKAQESFSGMVKGMERDARSMRRDLNDLGDQFVTMGEYAVTAAAVGLAAVVKHSFDAIDALGKSSDALGISTQKLAEMQYAAALAGVDTENFNGSMLTMTKNVADASLGVGKAQLAFKELGIDVDALVGMAPDKQFELIADKIGAIENPAIRAQTAMKVFGDSGAAMLTVMKDGADGMKSAAEEADALGLSISRVDAAKIEQANDAMTGAGKAFQGVGNVIAVTLAPVIEGMSKDFIKAASDAGGFKDIVQTSFDFIVRAAGYVADAIDGIRLVILTMKLGFQGAASVILTDAAAIAKGLNFIGVVSDESSAAMSAMADDMIAAIDKTKNDISDLATKMQTPHNYAKNVEAYKKASDQIAATAEKTYNAEAARIDANQARFLKACDEQAKKNQEMQAKIDEEATKYVAKSIIDAQSGQEKIRAEYDATMERFSGDTAAQLAAQEAAGELYRSKMVDLHGKVAAEMRDKNYQALKAMVKNTEDMSAEAVEKRQAALDEMKKRDDEWGQNFKDKFTEAAGAAKSMYDQMAEQGAAWGSAMKSTLTGVFEDGLKGNLKSAQDYLDVFKDAVIKAAAAMLAEWTAAYVAVAAKAWWTSGEQSKAASVGAVGAGATASSSAVAGGAASVTVAGTASGTAAASTAGTAAVGSTATTGAGSASAGISGGAVIGYGIAAGVAYKTLQSIFDPEAPMTPEDRYRYGDANSASMIIDSYRKLLSGKSAILDLDTRDEVAQLKRQYAGVKADWDALKTQYGSTITDAKPFPALPDPGIVGTGLNIKYETFADGGIMTARGALPLNAYAGGGIADRPQIAVFGEGSTSEAYVPLPDGKSIPVTMKGDSQQGGDVILMLDGQVLGRVLNSMSQQGRLKFDPIAIQGAYAI